MCPLGAVPADQDDVPRRPLVTRLRVSNRRRECDCKRCDKSIPHSAHLYKPRRHWNSTGLLRAHAQLSYHCTASLLPGPNYTRCALVLSLQTGAPRPRLSDPATR